MAPVCWCTVECCSTVWAESEQNVSCNDVCESSPLCCPRQLPGLPLPCTHSCSPYTAFTPRHDSSFSGLLTNDLTNRLCTHTHASSQADSSWPHGAAPP